MIDDKHPLYDQLDPRSTEGDDISIDVGENRYYLRTHLDQEIRWTDPVVILIIIVGLIVFIKIGVGGIGVVAYCAVALALYLVLHHLHRKRRDRKRTVGEELDGWKRNINEEGKAFEQCFCCNRYGFFGTRRGGGAIEYSCPNCHETFRVRE